MSEEDEKDENQQKAAKIGSLEADLAYVRERMAKLNADHQSMSGDLDNALSRSNAEILCFSSRIEIQKNN